MNSTTTKTCKLFHCRYLVFSKQTSLFYNNFLWCKDILQLIPKYQRINSNQLFTYSSSNEHHLGLKSDLERSVFSVDFFETFLRISTRSFSFPPSFWLFLHKYQFIVLLVKLKFWHYSESRVNNGGPEFSHVYLLFYIHNLFKMLSWEWKITVKNVTVRVSSANLSYWETETYNSNCHFDCRRRAF